MEKYNPPLWLVIIITVLCLIVMLQAGYGLVTGRDLHLAPSMYEIK